MNEAQLIAFMVLRLAYGGLFLCAGWQCVKSSGARQWTVDETRLMFTKHTRFFAMCGAATMLIGGACITLGLFPRIGAAGLCLFLLLGAKLHLIQRDRAMKLKEEALAKLPPELVGGPHEPILQELAVAGSLGHFSSALKNFCLAGIAAYFCLAGAGPWRLIGLDDLVP